MNALQGLTTKRLGRSYRHFEEIGSTNDFLKNNARELPHGAAVTAGLQTMGKGRLGKRWEARPGDCMALSVLLHGMRPERMGPLPLIAGLAVCEGVESLCDVACRLKWSNDVLLRDHKLCGILCESRIAGDGAFAVVGIGVNLYQTVEEFGRLGLVYAASLFSVTGSSPGYAELAAAILNRLEPLLGEYAREGFGPLRQRYEGRCVTLGRPVRVTSEGKEREGVATGIGPDGSLLCEIGGEARAVSAGETSVRGIYGYI